MSEGRFKGALTPQVALMLSALMAATGCKRTPVPTVIPTTAHDPSRDGGGLAEAGSPAADAAESQTEREAPSAAGADEARQIRRELESLERDPEDDPALTEDYFGAVEDGKAAEPPPRPTNLPGDRAFSIGPPNGGWLVSGKPITLRGRWHRVLPGTAQRGWHYGTDALIGIIQRSAAAVGEKYGGAPLRVGNMSRREGGKIAPSVSHQSGRDADIGIFALDLDGETSDPGGFPKFDGSRGDPSVDTTGSYLFDVARNWTFVSALVKDPGARIQWIFLDTPLKEMLLDYAVRTHENAELITRVEKVVVRPSNSSPHANHFHIRIFCTQGDIEYGCKDMGPEWDWVEAARAVDDALMDGLVDDIMAGRRQLDLMNPETGIPGPIDHDDPDTLRTPPIAFPAPKAPPPGERPAPASPDELPDPPTSLEVRLAP